MNLSLNCASYGNWSTWQGSVPFLYSIYVETGSSPQSFTTWLERFRGNLRPEDDIAEYLNENYKIRTASLADDAKNADQELRLAVQKSWQSTHEKRRLNTPSGGDALLATRLANHDVENFLGVVQRRQSERASNLGYSSWWLTLDHAAFIIAREIHQQFAAVSSPVMSADFLMNYLAFGPVRMRVSRQIEKLLPIVLELRTMESIFPELIEIANSVREKYKGQPEHVIRRKVRDALDCCQDSTWAYYYGWLTSHRRGACSLWRLLGAVPPDQGVRLLRNSAHRNGRPWHGVWRGYVRFPRGYPPMRSAGVVRSRPDRFSKTCQVWS